jgi:hypothetical protein
MIKLKDCKLKFVSRPRHYESADGTWLNGVTTVCDMFPKFLLPWATRVNADWAIDKINYLDEDEREESYALVKRSEVIEVIEQSKTQYENVRDEAAGKGTSAHGIIETWIKERKLKKSEDENVNNCVNEFIKWEQQNNVKWMASEWMVCNLDLGIAGTLDAIAEVNGVVTLVDFKTNKAIYPQSMYSQTAAYMWCLEYQIEDLFQLPKERMILRLPKDGSKFEAHKILSPLEVDKKMFKVALDMYNGTKHYKQYSGEKKYGK